MSNDTQSDPRPFASSMIEDNTLRGLSCRKLRRIYVPRWRAML